MKKTINEQEVKSSKDWGTAKEGQFQNGCGQNWMKENSCGVVLVAGIGWRGVYIDI